MKKKQIKKPEDVDLARYAFGAYQSYGNKPARIEDGEVFGQVNPCKFGEQCGGHACYCNHPKGGRKCYRSWYTGGQEPDNECELFEMNPYWRQVSDDFYENRDATIKHLREQGLLKEEA
jgi:hypothetical protein